MRLLNAIFIFIVLLFISTSCGTGKLRFVKTDRVEKIADQRNILNSERSDVQQDFVIFPDAKPSAIASIEDPVFKLEDDISKFHVSSQNSLNSTERKSISGHTLLKTNTPLAPHQKRIENQFATAKAFFGMALFILVVALITVFFVARWSLFPAILATLVGLLLYLIGNLVFRKGNKTMKKNLAQTKKVPQEYYDAKKLRKITGIIVLCWILALALTGVIMGVMNIPVISFGGWEFGFSGGISGFQLVG